MARPQVELTEKQAAQVEALAAYLSKEQIADYLGVARNTFDAILERDSLVFEHYKKGKAKAIANVAQGLVKQAIDGNMTAAIFYLKTQAGWRETQEIDLNARHRHEAATISDLIDELSNEQSSQT